MDMSLLEKGARLYEESTRLIGKSKLRIKRSGETLARCRYLLQQASYYMHWNAERHTDRTLQAD